MKPTETMIPLSAADRAVLGGRQRLLGRIMRWLYLLLAVALVGFVAKDILVYREFDLRNTREVIRGIGFIGSCFVATHAALAWSERRNGAALRADQAAGVKVRKTGFIVGVQESAESEPTRFQFSSHPAGETEEFALRTISDLRRIKPTALMGRPVEIDYAPLTRIVLQLRETSVS